MRNKILLIIPIFILSAFSLVFAQKVEIKGIITDSDNNQPLIGVNVVLNTGGGTTSDLYGNYLLEVDEGTYTLTFRFIGYDEIEKKVTVVAGQELIIDLEMGESSEQLDLVVVSASKYSRKISEETISIDVIKPRLIENSASTSLESTLTKISSVSVLDKSISIRGGSGYSFGAGSRVLVLVDEQPMLSADRGDIRLEYLPMEIIEQVEVVKGPSSALYGAGALNGMVSIRTKWPKADPETTVRVLSTIYNKPKDKSQAWWDHAPFDAGMYLSHAQRFGRFDLVVGGATTWNQGFIKGDDRRLGRVIFKTRYAPKNDRLTFGLGGGVIYSFDTDFFYWENSDSLFYPNEGAGVYTGRRTNVYLDPWVNYFDNKGNKHSLKGRLYSVKITSSGSKPHAEIYSADYQFTKVFPKNLTLITGTSLQQYVIASIEDDGLGSHKGMLGAVFGQVDGTFGKFNFGLGARWEALTLDEKSWVLNRPLFKVGTNFQASKSTFLRWNIGEGYRFPSVAEQFVNENQGEVNVFPNPNLQPEKGYLTEIGIKQSVKVSDWKGYIDLAIFYADYWDYIEFTFGTFRVKEDDGTFDYKFGFRSENISRVRLMGYEPSIYGEGSVGPIGVNIMAGYTYTYPAELNQDTTLRKIGNYIKAFGKSLKVDTDPEIVDPVLRYRFRHSFKGDIEFEYEGFSMGFDYRYYSYMENVDGIFEVFIPGIKDFRKEHDSGSHLFNMRASYTVKKMGRFTVAVNNVTNNLSSLRPAKIDAPRSFTFQFATKF